jgi:hypothetical protein
MSGLEFRSVERISSINKEEFTSSYFNTNKPLVINDIARSWPAFEKWTPGFFKKQHGDKKVKVYDESFVTAGDNYMSNAQLIPLRDYINQVMTKSQDLRMFLYNIKSEIPELANDITFPSLVDGISKSFIFMFFGCKGSVTQMHFDIDMSHVFHSVLYGKKTVYLFPFEQGKKLHRYPFTCRSYVDVEQPDFKRYPGLKDAQGYKVEIEAGDTLYIPAGYWHHFIYDEAGYAVSLRCANQTLLGKLHGFYHLIIMSSIDRLMNKIAPKNWFKWKKRLALRA